MKLKWPLFLSFFAWGWERTEEHSVESRVPAVGECRASGGCGLQVAGVKPGAQ